MAEEQQDLEHWFLKVYSELKQLAHYHLRGEAGNHTFNTTALVNEAFLKMKGVMDQEDLPKAVFFGLATSSMRRILIDYARKQKRHKRGAGFIHITHHDDRNALPTTPEEILTLNELLERFKSINERQYQVIEFWFFGGFKQEEIAEIMNLSTASVRRDWRLARAWLSRELKREMKWAG